MEPPNRSPFLQAVLFQENFDSTMVMLCVIYACMTMHAFGQLKYKSVNTSWLFLASVATACALRTMCFVGLCVLDRPSAVTSSSVLSDNLYQTAVILLFDLPDFMLTSTYVLLVVVWAESFLGSRRHWLPARQYKHCMHVCYLVFNVLLYGVQVVLYFSLFVDIGIDGIRLLYFVPACATFAIPVIHFFLYVFLCLRFAGFPMRSSKAAVRLSRITTVTGFWTMGRVSWAVAVLTSLLRTTHEGTYYIGSVAIVSLFVLTEVCPFVLSVDSGLLAILDHDDEPRRGPPRRGPSYDSVVL